MDPTQKTEIIKRIRTRLMVGRSVDEPGVWLVTGEDRNPDFSGSRSIPRLGYIQGTFGNILEWALGEPDFISYGYGGDIEKIIINVIEK